jgi:hypothetical protein
MHHWPHTWFGQIKIATWTKCYVRDFTLLLLFIIAPLNIAMHGPFCITTCIILRIAQLCIDLRIFFLYVLFGSSRVDIDTEQFEKEFLYVTPEDRVRAFSSDLTGEPTPSPILHFHALLIYCYPYIAILLCHVSYSTCCPILPNYTSSPYPLFVVCQLCES